MTHKYICETCGKEKTCAIAGCSGDCVQQCVKCLRRPQAVPPQQLIVMPDGGLLDYYKVRSLHSRLDLDLRAMGAMYLDMSTGDLTLSREKVTAMAMGIDEFLMAYGAMNGEVIAALGALLCARLKASAEILKSCAEKEIKDSVTIQ